MARGKDTGIDGLRTSLVSVILTFDLSNLTNTVCATAFVNYSTLTVFRLLGNNDRMGPVYHTHSLPKLCCSTVYTYGVPSTQYLQHIYKTRMSQRYC